MKTTYSLRITDVNFGVIKSQGWIDASEKLPSPSSYKEVLLIKEKHGGDVECISAGWMPKNQYTEGDFVCHKGMKIESKIYFWRALDFIDVQKLGL